MKQRTFLSIHAILLFLFGAGFLIAPNGMLSIYATSTNAIGVLTARVFGISSMQISVMMWALRQEGDARILNILTLLLFLGNALAFLLALQAQLAGLFNSLGWTNAALYFLFSAGHGMYLLNSITARKANQ